MNYFLIRPEIKDAMDRYAEHHVPLGDFLTAVMENNLMEAFGRSDEGNIAAMFYIVSYVYNELPSTCHGSKERVAAWLALRDTTKEVT